MNLVWYWMIDPPRGGISDTGQLPAFATKLSGPEGQQMEALLFLDVDGQPLFIKIRALEATDIYDTDRFIDLVELIKERYSSEVLLALDQTRLRTNRLAPREGCVCEDRSFWGLGDVDPFLEMVWPSETR